MMLFHEALFYLPVDTEVSHMEHRSLVEILDDMAEHTLANPTHGHNCACKDKYVVEVRQMLDPVRKEEFRLIASYILRS